jgi:hypothetical protein
MSGSGKDPVPNNQLVIYQPANWEVVDNNQSIKRRSTTIENVPKWLIRLFCRLQKAEEDVRALAAAAASADAIYGDVSELRDDLKILSEAATALFWETFQTIVTQAEKSPPSSKILLRVARFSARHLDSNRGPTSCC